MPATRPFDHGDQRDLRALALRAAGDDEAWFLLVQRLSPVVVEALQRAGLHPAEEAHVARSTWRALGRRLELPPPPGDLPGWVRDNLDTLAPDLMRLYATRLGKPAVARPMVLMAWEGAERNGYSLSGGVVDGGGVMAIGLSGKKILSADPAVTRALQLFYAHEASHFWMGQAVRLTRREDAWISEGGADFLHEQLRLLERGEVAAARHVRPMGDVVDRLAPRSRRAEHLSGESGDAGGQFDAVHVSPGPEALPVQAG